MKGILKRAAAVALALALAVALLASCSGSRTLLTVDGAAVTEEIMNYYVYISTSMLELYNRGALDYSAEIEEFGGRKLGDVIKELAYQQIMNDYAGLSLAKQYDLEFDEEEMTLIDSQVEKVIAGIGDNSTYREFLNTVKISDKTYRQMLRNQMLLDKVKEYLVADDGPMALTEEELAAATETFREDFVNVEYVVLSRLDLTNGEELDSATIAAQRELAQKVRALALNGSNFHKLIDKYSANKPSDGYSAYVKNDASEGLPEEFLRAAFSLKDGEISNVISTEYGFYVIKRLPYDELLPTVVKKTAQEEKYEKLLKEVQDRMTVVTTSAFNAYEVK